ncbi:hypothetical protein Bhyg_12634 [Pseudolycoriella hygida]|uniref:C-type lectin domain-containing protein n=1 Tax=Pseudolycoriella hygida TaxID=35572 RepID=A0A9Q0S1F8_9DIPT|nr:hypothetical protein Bhyg_12634 [Pseudolycoriella hygida]
MAKIISLLLMMLIAFVIQFQEIEGIWSIQPKQRQFCEYDAFISSKPVNGKVYLHPWATADRRRDWYEARGYCAKHCAEMATVMSDEENKYLSQFMIEIGYGTDVWLGAEVMDRTKFSTWNNGDDATKYHPVKPGEYDQAGHKCASNWYLHQTGFCNDVCIGHRLVVCQRKADWTICES